MNDITIRPFIEHKPLMIHSETPIKTVINLLSEHHTTGAPVVDAVGKLLGFISEKDCIGKLLLAAYYCDQIPTVNEMMSTQVTSVTPDDSLLDVAQMMVNMAPKLYPVVEDGKCIGIISRSHVLQALYLQVDHCFK